MSGLLQNQANKGLDITGLEYANVNRRVTVD